MSDMYIKIEYTALENLNPYKGNPKVHDEKQIQQIAKSIERFGFNNPILIDEKSEVIAGHGRLLAARLLKLETVPVVRLIHLSEAEKRAYRIADNKLSENGRWDTDLLKLEFSEIEKLALNLEDELNLDITGFDFKEIDVLLADNKSNEKADEKLNSVPHVPENEIVSQHGDVWLLGKHKIICGDSLKEETYQRLFEGVKANMVFTDPPFNVKIQGHVCGAGQTKHNEFAFASGEMNEAEFISFLKTSMANIQSTPDDFLLSNNHLRLLDRIFISHHQQCNLNILKQQIIDWMAMVLSEERENWSELKENLVQTLYSLDKKAEAVKRAKARDEKYAPFRAEFKQTQYKQFLKYQKSGKKLTANAFVLWFLKYKTKSIKIPYCETNQKNKLIQLAQANNREFKKAFECRS